MQEIELFNDDVRDQLRILPKDTTQRNQSSAQESEGAEMTDLEEDRKKGYMKDDELPVEREALIIRGHTSVFDQVVANTLFPSDKKDIDYYSEIELKKFQDDFERTGSPLIFRQKKQKNLSWEDLIECSANHYVEARQANFTDEPKSTTEHLPEFIKNVSMNVQGCQYAVSQKMPSEILSKIDFSDIFELRPRHYFTYPLMWVGPRGSRTFLHRDSSDNFILQLIGRKRWFLFSPSNQSNLEMEIRGDDFAMSKIDFWTDNSEDRKRHCIVVDLSPGQILYLPTGWAHAVDTIEASLMVNLWVDKNKFTPAVLGSKTRVITATET